MGKRNRLYVALKASNVWSSGFTKIYMQRIEFVNWAHYSGYFHGNVHHLITGHTKTQLVQLDNTSKLLHGTESLLISYQLLSQIPRILWKAQVHYRLHNSPPRVPTLNQSTQSTSLYPIYILLSRYRHTKSPLWIRFSPKTLKSFLFSPVRAICPAISSSLLSLHKYCFHKIRLK